MSQHAEAEALSPQQIEEKTRTWNQEEFVKIQKFCQSKGVQIKGLVQSRCQCLPPFMGVWYVVSTTKGEDYWVISGEFPTDLAPQSIAKNAREAIRYFSMNWQLKVAKLEDAMAEGKVPKSNIDTQKKIIQELNKKAEMLYQIMSDEKLWQQSGLTV